MVRAVPTNTRAIQLAVFIAFGMLTRFCLVRLSLIPCVSFRRYHCLFYLLVGKYLRGSPGFLFGYDIGVISVCLDVARGIFSNLNAIARDV